MIGFIFCPVSITNWNIWAILLGFGFGFAWKLVLGNFKI